MFIFFNQNNSDGHWQSMSTDSREMTRSLGLHMANRARPDAEQIASSCDHRTFNKFTQSTPPPNQNIETANHVPVFTTA